MKPTTPRFERYIGIRYSGRKSPSEGLKGLRVFAAREDHEAYQEWNESDEQGYWSRVDLAEWLLARLLEDVPTVVGIDHAFSLPQSYLDRHGLKSWRDFLGDFGEHWPTDRNRVRDLVPGNDRAEELDERRLTGRWAGPPPARGGLFRFELPDGLAKATHAGIPWLDYLRRAGERVHFWPFDGFAVPPGDSVVAEVRPAALLQRYRGEERQSEEEHEAFAICAWLQERDRLGLLEPYFEPPLSKAERERAQLEGWILGVM